MTEGKPINEPLEVYIEGANGVARLIPTTGARRPILKFENMGSAQIFDSDIYDRIFTGIFPAGDEGGLMKAIRRRGPSKFNAYSTGPSKRTRDGERYFHVTYFNIEN